MTFALAISGCDGDSSADSGSSAGYVPPTLEQVPTCNQIAATLGPMVDGLVLVEQEDGGRYDNETVYGISCTWLSQETQSGNVFDTVKGGSLTLGLSVDPEPSDVELLRQMGMVYDDERVEAIGGFVLDISRQLDPAAQLGIVGPQVVVGRVTITTAAGGIALQKVESLRGITNDLAIAGSVAVHKMLR
ncbi:lytic murein transglycosylase [Stutzerimonas stutzeri]|uniref:lytic murein transglycosylase n=1 Tax=Stutzerimonas stutzeri TaxID=316 RepID=UPI00210C46C8|nr:lytic murein transglycosylase [Stutzerimonas stutzeri]MCQ4257900.1 lytic murein transglycosylase [Stutzerimonas stutzeri]